MTKRKGQASSEPHPRSGPAPITHVPVSELDGGVFHCSRPECPWPDDKEKHHPWCAGKHRCWGRSTHQHHPKLGMGGGRRKSSRIVAIICQGMHNAVDNGTKYKNDVIEDERGRVYRLWETTPYLLLIERVIGEGDGTASVIAGVRLDGYPELEPAATSDRSRPVPLSAHPLEPMDDPLGEMVGKAFLEVNYANRETPTGMHGETGEQRDEAQDGPDGALPEGPGNHWAELPEVDGRAAVERLCESESPLDSEELGSADPGEPRHPARIDLSATTQIAHRTEKAPALPDVSLEVGRLTLREGLGFERYAEIVANLEGMQRDLNWWIGDAALYGEANYGESCYQAFSGFEQMGFGIERIKQCLWMAEKFPPVTRVITLPWSAHRVVAALPEPERAELLARAESEGMTTRELREAVREPKVCAHVWLTGRLCSHCRAWEETG